MKNDKNLDAGFWRMLLCVFIFSGAFWYTLYWAGILLGTAIVLATVGGTLLVMDSDLLARFKRAKR